MCVAVRFTSYPLRTCSIRERDTSPSSRVCGASSRMRSAAAMRRVPVPQAGSVIRKLEMASESFQSHVSSVMAREASRVAAAVVV